MTHHWILWQGSEADHWQWCLPGADGRFECPVQSGSLATAANMIGDQCAHLLLRSEQLLLTTTSINARNRKQVMAALPFRLEEQLAVSPEQLHLASRKSDHKGEYRVAIINRQLLRDLLERMTQSRIRLAGVFADVEAMPAMETGIALLVDKARVLVRPGAGLSDEVGFAATTATTGPLLALMNNQQGTAADRSETTLYTTGDPDPELLQSLSLAKEQCRSITQPLELLARGLDADRAINLLQGNFKSYVRNKQTPKIPALTLGLLLILLTVQATVLWLGIRHLENELSSAENHLNQTHQRQFGVDFPADNFRQSVLDRLAQRGSRSAEHRDAEFLEHLARIIRQMPSTLTLDQIDYSPSSLKLVIRSPNLANAETFQQRLRSARIAADITITDRRKDQVSLTLTVHES